MNAARPIAGKVCMQKKLRAFVEFARRYSIEELLDCLERNEQAGIVYHREGIMGDYDDFDDLEKLIHWQKS